ncbi:rhodanese-related sulfurtransferase [Melghirimyces profundicolus]|uniref:Rhodanese-related sulfurtransferase n=1 Tax=Melghirimyces profundicolus TaxID=1242148 RepID=A0A2T6C9T5_9BACL|nr:rhodanese-like domain-containing protein [Melghirimyces profundicolus]PTX65077.1 rhodanese-related sulfurtransferase [Melghirimyces profundicolus]
MEKRYTDVDAKKLSQADESERNRYVLVDVRTQEEYEEGHIPGARHIPHDQMEERAGELEGDKDKEILLICRSGRRSVIAANILADKGFKRLHNLKGGMLEWTGPTEK